MRFLWIIAAFALGNFFWQALTEQNWHEALKLSFFQATPVFYIWFFKVKP
jgi:hypothetical protein